MIYFYQSDGPVSVVTSGGRSETFSGPIIGLKEVNRAAAMEIFGSSLAARESGFIDADLAAGWDFSEDFPADVYPDVDLRPGWAF